MGEGGNDGRAEAPKSGRESDPPKSTPDPSNRRCHAAQCLYEAQASPVAGTRETHGFPATHDLCLVLEGGKQDLAVTVAERRQSRGDLLHPSAAGHQVLHAGFRTRKIVVQSCRRRPAADLPKVCDAESPRNGACPRHQVVRA